MAYEPKDNSGALFKNDRKEKETHPDRKGGAVIGGVEYWVSGWLKQDRNGNPFLSMSFELKQKAEPKRAVKARAGGFDDMDDDIPF